ncbi:tripartite tricarboxylate transporter substrate binding protein [Ramlibacter sp. AW1]|uniref:Tripartite tricarboxylate transporter substrate binding protein n=1 Tax=Ramlibacter aurantiacus TaxID=2801330 RepID=A0A937D1X0_9BURK|nr:tripartite tricarboxylate transporter substrate binding protein [Ramlibacter aurantiacus]MBL0419195.1 tripartite tricarboxylate transporter substrate binding protein [Ramlibacter aurantiacus]
MTLITRRTLLGLAAAACAPVALAQPAANPAAWPERPIKLIVPLPPGGAYDYIGRLMADHLRTSLNGTVVVENKFGAGARIGTEFVARAPADGYTFLLMASTHVILPSMVQKLPYDAIRDFEPVSRIVDSPMALVVNPNVQARSVAELVGLSKAKPDSLAYGSSGTGSPFHLAGELLKLRAGVLAIHVPYKGTGPLMNALLANEVPMAFVPIGPYLPHLRSGKLRAVAVVSRAPSELLPGVPTLGSTIPLPSGMESWVGMVAPAGTPRPIVERMSAELRKIVTDPQLKSRLMDQGYEPVGSTPQELAQVMRDGLASYARLVQDAKIQPE